MKNYLVLVLSFTMYQTSMAMMPHIIKSCFKQKIYTHLSTENGSHMQNDEKVYTLKDAANIKNTEEPFIITSEQYNPNDPRWNDKMLFYKECQRGLR